MGFGEYGEMLQDVGRYGERLFQKLATNFVSQYSASIILPFMPIILKQQQKALACVLLTVGVGRCGKMLEKVERCGVRLPSKQHERFESK